MYDAKRLKLIRHRTVTSTVSGTHCNRNRVQGFKFIGQRTEVSKVGDSFGLELVLPSNGPDDLTNDLRQPTQGMCLVQRDRVDWRRQEVTTLGNQRLQIEFYGLPVEQDDRTRIPSRHRVRFEV